jgi:hypothetical protein
MTITLELKPEVEERVSALASAQGLSLEAYLLALIESMPLPAVSEQATVEEFEAAMDALAEGSDDLPVLSPEALTRESIYGDRA